MPEPYYDIRQQINKPPQWFDSNRVPRYCRFHPDRSPAFMPDEVVLFEIACQGCRKILRVEAYFSRAEDGSKGLPSLRKAIRNKTLKYGDPPGHTTTEGQECGDCCMASVPLKVLQFWRRRPTPKKIDPHWLGNRWARVRELEGLDIEGAWGLYPLFPGPTKSRYWTARMRAARRRDTAAVTEKLPEVHRRGV
jgi:hypothetical protein